MSEAANVAPGGAVDSTPALAAPVDNSPLSLSEAVALRSKGREPDDDAVEAPQPPAREKSAAKAEDGAPPEEAPAETAEGEDDPAPKPSIDPPRSWTKEDKEAFAALPPEVQTRIAERERAREAEFRRGQNEIAEQRKQAEGLRSQYEQQLPALLQALEQHTQGEYGDIQNWDDVTKMAEEDPFRYSKWQAHQARLSAVKAQAAQVAAQRQQETQKAFETYAEEQDRLFLERAPEFSDGRSAEKARRDAAEYLTKEIGFDADELGAAWNGQKGISLRDAKVQTIIRDAMKWRAAEKASKAAKPTAPVPAVQKPGVVSSKGERRAGDLQALDNRLSETGSLRDAAALLAARRAQR